jgi:hypothetical protein
MKELLPQLVEALITVVTAIVIFLLTRLTSAIQSKVKGEQASTFIERASSQARDVVLELEQTLVPSMRKAASDGKLDQSDVDVLRDEALRTLKLHLGPKGLAEGMQVLGFKGVEDLERVLRAKIEAEVALLPKQFVTATTTQTSINVADGVSAETVSKAVSKQFESGNTGG